MGYRKRNAWLLALTAWSAILSCSSGAVWGVWPQESTAGAGTEAAASATDKSAQLQAAQRDYEQAVNELKRLTKEAFQARLAYETGTREESEANRQAWDLAVQQGELQRTVLEEAAVRLVTLSEKPSDELLKLLSQIHLSRVRAGYWHRAEVVAKLLRGPKADDQAFLFRDAIASISSNQFEAAEKFFKNFGHLIEDMPDEQQALFLALPELIQKYEREKKFLAQDAAGEPLPRVVLKTTKGRIELELFEDQAPLAVANFIDLVEQGFFTNINFHRVIHGFMAQSGGYGTDKRGRDLGYAIPDEYGLRDARNHFQGYVSMANAEVPQTSCTEFFITFVPTPHLDGKHTVFGRVIDGFDAFESINRTDYLDKERQTKQIPGVTPDYIISAEVIRKRNHEYKSRKL